MKIFNRHINIGALLLLAIFADMGCKKQLNINQDPSLPTLAQGTPALVFPVGVLATMGKTGGDLAIVGGMWSQFFTQAALAQQYTDIDSYNMLNLDGNVQDTWDVMFPDGLKNFQYVIDQSKTQADWNFYLLGTVMKAYATEVLVDLYDQIPYTQALDGSNNLDPKFDDGYTIYTNLIASIDTALSKDFTASTVTNPGTQDLIFGGNMTSWIAFANTLKLKMYLRMINAHADVATTAITAMLTAGTPFLDNSTGGAEVTNFTDAPFQDNPLYEQNIRQLNTTINLKASKTFVSWLEANQDTARLQYFFASKAPITIDQGNFRSSNTVYQKAAVFVQSPKDPVEFISLPESFFLQAEADFRYNGGANVKSLYNSGVLAAFAQMGIDGSPYIASGGPYAWGAEMEAGAALDPIQQIIRQKWASCAFGCHGIESYFDHNRTGYPLQSPVYSTDPSYVPGQLVVVPNSVLVSPTAMPKRFVFPYDETSRNTNAPTAIPSTTPVWWGK